METPASVRPIPLPLTQRDSLPAECNLCGSSRREHLFSGPDRLLGFPGMFAFVRCSSCGLIYQWPRLPWEQLKSYYQGDYTSYAQLSLDEPSPLRRAIKRWGQMKQRRYVEQFRREGDLLDVGCGTGLFLSEMQLAGGWRLQGLEPTHEAAAYVQTRLGISVIEQPFEQADLPPTSQDIITLWHVLEHVMSPMDTLRKAYDVLRPGGLLIIAIPNYESLGRHLFGRFWVGWDLPRHLFVFPRPILERIFLQSGFRIISRRCFLISYASLGHSLTFWLQTWPTRLQPLAHVVRRIYYSAPARIALYPLQILIERLGLASVTTWTAQKVSDNVTS